MTKRPLVRLFSITLVLLASAAWCSAQLLTLQPFKQTGIYDLSEPIGWTITLMQGTVEKDYRYEVRKNNLEVIKRGDLDLAHGPAKIEVTVAEPAMVYLEIVRTAAANKNDGVVATAGAAVAPEKLEPSVPRPDDFDSFWASKIKMLKAVRENAVLTPGDSGVPSVEYATIKMDHMDGKNVYGQFAKPKKPGKFPALVILQWASPPYPLQKRWVTDHAEEGWLTLNIEPHNVLPDQPQSYYDALPQPLKNYHLIGRNDRNKNYFLQMYLADYRAVEYITKRPDWDGKTLVVMGTSMGGQQSLAVAGLHPKITHVIVNEPAGCDTHGPLLGRASGYPNWPVDDLKIRETSKYFDVVNFASSIKAHSLVAIGFTDTVAPTVGIWIAFNQIKGPKEAAPMVDSPHNNMATPEQQRPYTSRSAQWLDDLVQHGEVRSTAQDTAKVLPVKRTDNNSRIAHEQLLEKRKKGRIDIYFLGDSITRRWGATDQQYQHLLANWRENFFGWNAANFGWGGDRVENILWRLENGELDDVNPKVIVLMAGTNNIGKALPPEGTQAKVDEITNGIGALIALCKKKAPGATIILMGITPRNDNMEVMTIVNHVNDVIAGFADGKSIRYVNINSKLADEQGRLHPGMTLADGLHLDLPAYRVWASELKPILTELLGPPAKEDHAPPPTGDPSARQVQP